MKLRRLRRKPRRIRRSPRGERGLKYVSNRQRLPSHWSLPPRGAWIEIRFWQKMAGCSARRSPRGERGLKCRRHHPRMDEKRRSPRGERGLKYVGFGKLGCELMSLPPRGAWIEILFDACSASTHGSRSPRGERGLKWECGGKSGSARMSLPPAGSVD